jgi:hypothetical protein
MFNPFSCFEGDDEEVYIPIGLPFVGGSDDPSDYIGLDIKDGDDKGEEKSDPGV